MSALVKVTDDLFHIARRLKEIDPLYELYFNRPKRRFEIYANGAMQVALPFDRLDARAVDFARKTRLENAEKLILEIERTNDALDVSRRRESYERRMAQMEDLL